MTRNSPQEFIVSADGWVAGKWRARGSTVTLTEAEAKYENVSRASAAVDPAAQEDDTVAAENTVDPFQGNGTKRGRRGK